VAVPNQTLLRTPPKCRHIISEKLLQTQRVLARHHADRIRDAESLRALGDFRRPNVLPEVREVVEGVRIDPMLHRFGPLLVG
jgi:hypothetical protein